MSADGFEGSPSQAYIDAMLDGAEVKFVPAGAPGPHARLELEVGGVGVDRDGELWFKQQVTEKEFRWLSKCHLCEKMLPAIHWSSAEKPVRFVCDACVTVVAWPGTGRGLPS